MKRTKFETSLFCFPVPSPPWNISVNQKSAREVEVRWEPPIKPNGVVVNYAIFMSPPFPPYQQILAAKPNSFSIKTDFEVGQNYSFWVKLQTD